MSSPLKSQTTTPSLTVGIRERNRLEITKEILSAAHKHLATHGAEGLSLRAITRELGMASSAIYRYFASRDELLTALIIEAYTNLGDDVNAADQTIDERENLHLRWLAIAHGIRAWAKAYPHQWALIYGTPISGYAAPVDTIAAATRATEPMLRLLVDQAKNAGHIPQPHQSGPQFRTADPGMSEVLEQLGAVVQEERFMDGIGAWAQIVGLVSLELFGHLENVIQNRDSHFAYHAEKMAEGLGLVEAA